MGLGPLVLLFLSRVLESENSGSKKKKGDRRKNPDAVGFAVGVPGARFIF